MAAIMFLDPDELDDLNADLEATLDSVGRVLRAQPAEASDGGTAGSVQPHGKPVPCAVWQERPRSAIALAGGAMKADSDWRALVPRGADVRAGDQLQVGDLLLHVSGSDAGTTDGIGHLLLCKRVI